MAEITKRFPVSRRFDSTALHGELKQQFGDLFDSLDTENDGERITLTLRFTGPLERNDSDALGLLLDAHQPPVMAQAAPVLDLAQRVEQLEKIVALLSERV